MKTLLVKAVQSFLEDFSKENQVFDDFLLIETWVELELKGGKLGEVKFQGQIWPLVWCDCELNLRREINKTENLKAILLLPESGEDDKRLIPLDIRSRSHRQIVIPLGLNYLLAAETGVRWPEKVGLSEYKPSVMRHYDALVKEASGDLINIDISNDQLDELLIQTAFGFEVASGISAKIIRELFIHNAEYSPFPLDLDLLRGQLSKFQVEHIPIILWCAEEPGRARDLLFTSAIMRVENQSGLTPSWGSLQPLLGKLLNFYPQDEALENLSNLSFQAWQLLPTNKRRKLMKQVETQLDAYQTVDIKTYNDMSPRALRAGIQQLAERMAEGKREQETLNQFRKHLFASIESSSLETLEGMDELISWKETLAVVLDDDLDVLEWIKWYIDKGAFADLAALYLKNSGTPKLNQEIEAVLQQFWESRSEINMRFGEAFLGKYEDTIYSPDVIGTHKFLARIVAPLLKSKQRVLFIVLDGLNYPLLIHLVNQLNQHKTQQIGVKKSFTGLSILPSITSSSRKAIFLGERPTDTLDSEDEYAEKAKTTESAALEKFFKGHQVAIHNRTTLTAPGGKSQLFIDISDLNIELVSLVLNEVDEGLKGGNDPKFYNPDELGVLFETLTDGFNTNRRVFLLSDHGHTWHLNKDRRQSDQVPGGGHRHMPLGATDLPPENTLVTTDPEIMPPGVESFAFLYRVGDYFGRQPMRGYHGGVSLEEIVIPCVELSYDGQAMSTDIHFDTSQSESGESVTETEASGLILTLEDGQRIRLDITGLSRQESQALQLLARKGRVNEQQFRKHLNTRRVSGIVSKLMDKLGRSGFDFIEVGPSGSGGTDYIFKKSGTITR